MTASIGGLPARGMRRSLRWGLGVTLLATVAALLWPTPAVVAVSARSGEANSPAATAASSAALDGSTPPLVRTQPFAEGTPASAGLGFDPFAGAPASLPVAPPPVASAPVAPPPPPPPPVQDYRFVGRVTGPDGGLQILLGRRDAVVSVSKGMVLDNGYVVESVSASTVVLVHAASGARSNIVVPSE